MWFRLNYIVMKFKGFDYFKETDSRNNKHILKAIYECKMFLKCVIMIIERDLGT